VLSVRGRVIRNGMMLCIRVFWCEVARCAVLWCVVGVELSGICFINRFFVFKRAVAVWGDGPRCSVVPCDEM
jgi:hypothetical protein